MQIKSITWALALIAIAGVLAGAHYVEGNYWRNKLLAAPAETVKVTLPPIRESAPPETVFVKRNAVVIVKTDTIKTQVDSLQFRITQLEQPSEVIITDKEGGSHDIKYDPITEEFHEVYTPVTIIQPTEKYISKMLPEVRSEGSHWWVESGLLYQSGAGIVLGIGRGEVGILFGNVSDKPVYGLSLHLNL